MPQPSGGMKPKILKTEAEYNAALARWSRLWMPPFFINMENNDLQEVVARQKSIRLLQG